VVFVVQMFRCSQPRKERKVAMRHKVWLSREFCGLWMWAIGLALLAGLWGAGPAVAATAKEIDVSVDVAL
jgi:hypothetical protein